MKDIKKMVPNITWSFEEGRFWDLWMLSHITAGIVLGLLFELLEVGFFIGFFVSLILMIAWEVGEVYFDIEETIENRILDVVYGIIAYALSYSIAVPLSPWISGLALGFFTAAKGMVEYRGWKAYRARTGKSK